MKPLKSRKHELQKFGHQAVLKTFSPLMLHVDLRIKTYFSRSSYIWVQRHIQRELKENSELLH